MHSACVCTPMHYAAIHVTCVLVGMRLYRSTGPVSSLKLRLWPPTVPKGLKKVNENKQNKNGTKTNIAEERKPSSYL